MIRYDKLYDELQADFEKAWNSQFLSEEAESIEDPETSKSTMLKQKAQIVLLPLLNEAFYILHIHNRLSSKITLYVQDKDSYYEGIRFSSHCHKFGFYSKPACINTEYDFEAENISTQELCEAMTEIAPLYHMTSQRINEDEKDGIWEFTMTFSIPNFN